MAILGEPVFIEYISKYLQRLIPQTTLEITPISNYDEFFKLSDDEIDGLIETVEIGATLTLLHPEYSTIVPKTSVLQFPMSYAIPQGETKFQIFLTQWLRAKKYNGLIHQSKEYWVSGKGAEKQTPRWSIKNNVLGW